MMSALDEFLSELRGILSQWPPGPEHWKALCSAFDRDLSEECLKGGLEYAVRVVEALWPDELCVAPEHWRAAALQGQQHPAWALVRMCDVYLSDVQSHRGVLVKNLRERSKYGVRGASEGSASLLLWSCCPKEEAQRVKFCLESNGLGATVVPFGAPILRKVGQVVQPKPTLRGGHHRWERFYSVVDVWLVSGGPDITTTIETIHEFKGGEWDLGESKAFLDASPAVLFERMQWRDASKLKALFSRVGGVLHMVGAASPNTPELPTTIDGSEAFNETLSKLRCLLFDEPSHEGWQQICHLFESDVSAEDMRIMLDYALPVLEKRWPAALREPPDCWHQDPLVARLCVGFPQPRFYDVYLVDPGHSTMPMMFVLPTLRGLSFAESRKFLSSLPAIIGKRLSSDGVRDLVQVVDGQARDRLPSIEVVMKIVPCGEPFEAEGVRLDELRTAFDV